jgi:hypothetical protein
VNLYAIHEEEFAGETDAPPAVASREALDRFVDAFIDYAGLYKSFVESQAFRAYASQLAADGAVTAAGATEAVRRMRRHVGLGAVRRHDLPIIGWLVRWFAEGVPPHPQVRFIKPWSRVRHLVVDEAQDFSPVQLQLLLDAVDPRSSCVTASGDLKQRLNHPAGLSDWASGGLRIASGEGHRGVFRVNYRQTTRLGTLAYDYYKAHFGEPVPFVPRQGFEGPAPCIIRGGRLNDRLEILAERLVGAREEQPGWTAVVVSDDKEVRERAARVLIPRLREEHIRCRRSKGVDLRDTTTVHICSTAAIKGLEFGVVCLVEPAATLRGRTDDQGLRTMYVSITRPARHLIVTCATDLPRPLLPAADHFVTVRAQA